MGVAKITPLNSRLRWVTKPDGPKAVVGFYGVVTSPFASARGLGKAMSCSNAVRGIAPRPPNGFVIISVVRMASLATYLGVTKINWAEKNNSNF